MICFWLCEKKPCLCVDHSYGPSAFPDWKLDLLLYLFFFFLFLFLHWSFISCVFVYVCVSSSSFPTVHHPFPAMPRMHSLGAVREAWGTVIKDHLKVQNWIQRDEQVEGRTKTASFTSTCFFIAFFKRTSESSLLLLNKKVFFTLIFWENTHFKKKIIWPFSQPPSLTRLSFKNQSCTKHRKMQHWTQH